MILKQDKTDQRIRLNQGSKVPMKFYPNFYLAEAFHNIGSYTIWISPAIELTFSYYINKAI